MANACSECGAELGPEEVESGGDCFSCRWAKRSPLPGKGPPSEELHDGARCSACGEAIEVSEEGVKCGCQ